MFEDDDIVTRFDDTWQWLTTGKVAGVPTVLGRHGGHRPFPTTAGVIRVDRVALRGLKAVESDDLGLVERGMQDVVLLEAHAVGHGASGRNGGFVFGGFSLGEERLLQSSGKQRARELYAGTVEAVETIRNRIRRYGITCDDTQAGVLWANWFDDPAVLLARQRMLADVYGVDWEWVDRRELRDLLHTTRYGDALFEPRAFHFNPLKYITGLAAAASAGGRAVPVARPRARAHGGGAGAEQSRPLRIRGGPPLCRAR